MLRGLSRKLKLPFGDIMNEKQIRQLIKIVEESDIDELEVSRWGRRVRITRNRTGDNGSVGRGRLRVDSGKIESERISGEDVAGLSAGEDQLEGNLIEIKSPMVGTYYAASAPDADAYIAVGDNVKIGDVLCIVEAMKLMNEIESEYTGVIKKILVENAKPVQYNQPLFLIDTG